MQQLCNSAFQRIALGEEKSLDLRMEVARPRTTTAASSSAIMNWPAAGSRPTTLLAACATRGSRAIAAAITTMESICRSGTYQPIDVE